MLEKTFQEQAQEAHHQKEEAIKLWAERSQNVFQLGKILYEIKRTYRADEENETYEGIKLYGFQTFGQLLSATQKSGGLDIPASSADRAVRLYGKYCVDLGIPVSTISKFNYSKLDTILTVVNKDNIVEWLRDLEDTPPGDLIRKKLHVIETGQFPDPNAPITTAIQPATARDWLESFELLHQTIKETFINPSEKRFIKDVYAELWSLIRTTIERKSRGTEHKKASDKALKAMEYIIKL